MTSVPISFRTAKCFAIVNRAPDIGATRSAHQDWCISSVDRKAIVPRLSLRSFCRQGSRHNELIDDLMHASDVLAQGHRQLAFVKSWNTSVQHDAVARHDDLQLAEAHKVLRGKELLDPVSQFDTGRIVD